MVRPGRNVSENPPSEEQERVLEIGEGYTISADTDPLDGRSRYSAEVIHGDRMMLLYTHPDHPEEGVYLIFYKPADEGGWTYDNSQGMQRVWETPPDEDSFVEMALTYRERFNRGLSPEAMVQDSVAATEQILKRAMQARRTAELTRDKEQPPYTIANETLELTGRRIMRGTIPGEDGELVVLSFPGEPERGVSVSLSRRGPDGKLSYSPKDSFTFHPEGSLNEPAFEEVVARCAEKFLQGASLEELQQAFSETAE
ncbi:hypothetical protein KJ596_01955 [Patescibacteria group bacterium]|nr:hypothetical protein [Patescibacteria group bacterium]MBU1868001.1 hypothetical protein [Patescibacteria group bacterium]